jgi:hypothetical protein
MWFTPRGMQVMSVPDLSGLLQPEVVEALSTFIARLDEGGRTGLSRALDSVVVEVEDEWREQIGNLDGEAEFDHALPLRPIDVMLPSPLEEIDDVVGLLEQMDLRWRADAASALQLHYLKDFEGPLGWCTDEPEDTAGALGKRGDGQRNLVSASIAVLRRDSPVIGAFRDDTGGEWLFFSEGDDWARGITGAPTTWDEMLRKDPSLAELKELPLRHGAWRPAPGEPWQTVGSLAELSALCRA